MDPVVSARSNCSVPLTPVPVEAVIVYTAPLPVREPILAPVTPVATSLKSLAPTPVTASLNVTV